MAEPYIAASDASSPKRALERDLRRLRTPTPISRNEIWERLQLDHFLLTLAEGWSLGFPVTIQHTSTLNPDFAIVTPSQKVGVECSRITNEKLHRLEHLEQTGKINSTVSLNPFLMDSGDMKNSEIVNTALGVGQFYPYQWSKPEDHDQFWFRCVDDILRGKTEAMDKPDYQACEHYWLLLKDEMSFDQGEIEQRAHMVHTGYRAFGKAERSGFLGW